LKKGQDPTELFDHITEVNTQYGIDSPDKKKLIALALEKQPERYVNAFTTLSMGGNMDLEMFEETVEAICQANQSNAKSNDEDDEEINLATFDKARRRRRTASGRKRAMKAMTKKNVSIAEEKDTYWISVGCWTRIGPNNQNGLIWKHIAARKRKKCPMWRLVI
jgi:rubrerythrin